MLIKIHSKNLLKEFGISSLVFMSKIFCEHPKFFHIYRSLHLVFPPSGALSPDSLDIVGFIDEPLWLNFNSLSLNKDYLDLALWFYYWKRTIIPIIISNLLNWSSFSNPTDYNVNCYSGRRKETL
jgi:hypothetical protein